MSLDPDPRFWGAAVKQMRRQRRSWALHVAATIAILAAAIWHVAS